jgi:hypothetical protein
MEKAEVIVLKMERGGFLKKKSREDHTKRASEGPSLECYSLKYIKKYS